MNPSEIKLRIWAFFVTLTIWIAIIAFSLWDVPLSSLRVSERFFVAFVGFILSFWVALCPVFDKD